MEIPSFSQQTGLGLVRKSYRQKGLRNGIILGIKKKHIRIGNKFDCVEGVKCMFDVIFVTHKSMMTLSTQNVSTPYWYDHTRDVFVHAASVLLKIS